MNLSLAGWGLIIFLIMVVIGINLSLIDIYRRKGRDQNEIDLLKKAAGQLKNPWQEEDRSLDELSRQVAR